MTNLNDLIQRLRTRPVQVRRRIAMMTSGAVTAVVALVWLTASLALGAFSANPAPAAPTVAADLGNTFAAARAQTASALAGTAAPFSGAATTSAPAPASSDGITVVQTATTTSSMVQMDPSARTQIPF